MNVKIISAFPCCGKTFYYRTHNDLHTLDLDSSSYSWESIHGTKVRNPDFPDNYIEAIEGFLPEYDFIFVSSHISIRTALKNRGLSYILVYPDNTPECIHSWKKRCYNSNKKNLWDMFLEKCWYSLLHSCRRDSGAIRHYHLQSDEYIDLVVNRECSLG